MATLNSGVSSCAVTLRHNVSSLNCVEHWHENLIFLKKKYVSSCADSVFVLRLRDIFSLVHFFPVTIFSPILIKIWLFWNGEDFFKKFKVHFVERQKLHRNEKKSHQKRSQNLNYKAIKAYTYGLCVQSHIIQILTSFLMGFFFVPMQFLMLYKMHFKLFEKILPISK